VCVFYEVFGEVARVVSCCVLVFLEPSGKAQVRLPYICLSTVVTRQLVHSCP